MSWLEITVLALTFLVMLVGMLGSLIPILPSTPIVFAAAVIYKLCFWETGPRIWVLIVLAVITAFSFLIDHIATVIGARKFGASWRGITGAVVGGIVGIFFSLPGILLGPFIGAVAFELAGQRTLKESSQAGVGAFVGLLAGTLGKLACCAVMIGLFAFDLIYRGFTN